MTVLFTLAASIALAACLVAVLTYVIFYYELANRPQPLFTAVYPGQPLAGLARGLATSFASQALMLLTYPLGRCLVPRLARRPGPQEPVVVCLHGLYHNPAAFLALRPALRRAGFDHVLVLAYGSFHTDFETVAARLLAEVRRIVPPQTPLIVIGHSLGGLIARRLMAEPDLACRVRAVVTLGSPHQGSKLAALALGRLGRSLLPSGPLLAQLDALPDPPGARLTALVSPLDNMVIPLTGLAIDRPAWTTEVTVPVSHIAMLYHPAVITRVVELAGGQGAREDAAKKTPAGRQKTSRVPTTEG
jgi:triacylglycerol lipase